MQNGQYKGIISFDGMFSIIPILLLVVFVLNTMNYLMYDSIDKVTSQEKFNMLVMIADYVVKNPYDPSNDVVGAAHSDGNKFYPNLINPAYLDDAERQLREDAKMPGLKIMLDGPNVPSDQKTCIYRIVVNKDNGEIDRLFVCG